MIQLLPGLDEVVVLVLAAVDLEAAVEAILKAAVDHEVQVEVKAEVLLVSAVDHEVQVEV